MYVLGGGLYPSFQLICFGLSDVSSIFLTSLHAGDVVHPRPTQTPNFILNIKNGCVSRTAVDEGRLERFGHWQLVSGMEAMSNGSSPASVNDGGDLTSSGFE